MIVGGDMCHFVLVGKGCISIRCFVQGHVFVVVAEARLSHLLPKKIYTHPCRHYKYLSEWLSGLGQLWMP